MAVGLETERLRVDQAESSKVRGASSVQGVSEGPPVYTVHAPPVYKET